MPMSLILLTLCSMFMIELMNEYEYKKRRDEKRKTKIYSSVPWDAAETLDLILKENKNKNKEYKLAALVVEDENGHTSIEDIDLRGEDAGQIKLSDFASKRTRDKADSFFFSFPIINALTNKVNYDIGNVERYYAFELTKENLLSGRHGKKKTRIKKDYVMFFDLSYQELNIIANLSF